MGDVRNWDDQMLKSSISHGKVPVVLVHKKYESLQFSIDFHKLNARSINDAYSLPQINELWDCFNEAW